MAVLPFRMRARAPRRVGDGVVRLREPGASTWRSLDGPAGAEALRAAWPRHGSRVAVLVGDGLDAETVDRLRHVHHVLGISAIDRADGACHAPATAVIRAAFGHHVLARNALVRAECIVTIGTPEFEDPGLDAELRIARAAGIPIHACSETAPTYATEHHAVSLDETASFLQATVRELLAEGAIDRAFIHGSTSGFAEFFADLESDATPNRFRVDPVRAEAVRAFVARIRSHRGVAVVWRPSVQARDALIARAVVGLLLVRGALAAPGGGLCVTGPLAELHATDCCALRSSGLNTGFGSLAQPLGIIDRARLGDLDVLLTIGSAPFGSVDRDSEREALDAIRTLVHIGTSGSDALPVLRSPVLVLPGQSAIRLEDLARAVAPTAPTSTLTPGVTPTTTGYTFVARVVGERHRHGH